MENQIKSNKKKLFITLLVAMLMVYIILGGTYAWLRIGVIGSKMSIIKAGVLDLILDETTTNGIRLEHEIPKSYGQGIQNQAYTFKLKNNSTIDTDYELVLEDYYVGNDSSLTENDKIADNLIRYILVKNNEQMVATNSKLLSTGRTIETGTISGKSGNTPTEISYTLYVWIDSRAGDNASEANIMNKIFNARLKINAEQHHGSSVNYKNYAIGDIVYYNPITAEYCNNTSELRCYEWIVTNVIDNKLDLMYLRENSDLEASSNNAFTTMENRIKTWSDELTVDDSYNIPSNGSYAGYTYSKARLPIPDDYSGIIDQKLQEYNIAIASGVVGIPVPTVVLNYNNTNYGVRYYGGGNTLMWQTAPLTLNYVTDSGYKLYVHPVIRIEKESIPPATKPLPSEWEPTYFAYGRTPTTSDTEYPSGHNVFAAMDAAGNRGACIIMNGTKHCFRINNVGNEFRHSQHVFGEGTYSAGNDGYDSWEYGANNFYIAIFYDGGVRAYNYNSPSEFCDVNSNGYVTCAKL